MLTARRKERTRSPRASERFRLQLKDRDTKRDNRAIVTRHWQRWGQGGRASIRRILWREAKLTQDCNKKRLRAISIQQWWVGADNLDRNWLLLLVFYIIYTYQTVTKQAKKSILEIDQLDRVEKLERYSTDFVCVMSYQWDVDTGLGWDGTRKSFKFIVRMAGKTTFTHLPKWQVD